MVLVPSSQLNALPKGPLTGANSISVVPASDSNPATEATQSDILSAMESALVLLAEISEKLNNGITNPSDTIAPVVQLLNAPLPSATVGIPYSFTLQITDAGGVNESTITAAAIEIRRPDNATVAKTITSITGGVTQKNVAIQTTPGVTGAFTIASLAGLIADNSGNTATATALGGFTVNAPSGTFAALTNANDLTYSLAGQSNAAGRNGGSVNASFATWANSNLAAPYTIVKTAVDGTGFEGGVGRWAVASNDLAEDFATALLARKNAGTANSRFTPIVWWQGERDATSESFANAYITQFNLFREYVKNESGLDLPWIVIRLHSSSLHPFTSTIRAAQDTLAAQGDVYLINIDDLPMNPDLLHYNAPEYATVEARVRALIDSEQLIKTYAQAVILPIVDTATPVVSLVNAPLPPATSNQVYNFSVRVTDNIEVDLASITTAAFSIRRPDNSSLPFTISSITGTATNRVANIQCTPNVAETFTVSLVASTISDTSGNFSAAATLGTFSTGSVPFSDLEIDFVATPGVPVGWTLAGTTASNTAEGLNLNPNATFASNWGSKTTGNVLYSNSFALSAGRAVEVYFSSNSPFVTTPSPTTPNFAVGLASSALTSTAWLSTAGSGVYYLPTVGRIFNGTSQNPSSGSRNYAANREMLLRLENPGTNLIRFLISTLNTGTGNYDLQSTVEITPLPGALDQSAQLFFDAFKSNILISRIRYIPA